MACLQNANYTCLSSLFDNIRQKCCDLVMTKTVNECYEKTNKYKNKEIISNEI